MLDLCIAQDLEHRNGVEMFVQLVLLKRIAVTVLNSNIPRSPRKKNPLDRHIYAVTSPVIMLGGVCVAYKTVSYKE